MPSTYTTRWNVELQGSGENDGAWGTKLNAVISQTEEAVDGYLAKSVAGSSNVTLTATDGTADESRQRVLDLTGALTDDIDVLVEDTERWWFVHNNTTGNFDITFKPTGGTGVVLPRGTVMLVQTRGDTTARRIGEPAYITRDNALGTIGGSNNVDLALGDAITATASSNLTLIFGTSNSYWQSGLFQAWKISVAISTYSLTLERSSGNAVDWGSVGTPSFTASKTVEVIFWTNDEGATVKASHQGDYD